MSIFLLIFSALSFMGMIAEKTDKSKLCFALTFVVSVLCAVVCKVI